MTEYKKELERQAVEYHKEQALIKDTKKRTAQRHELHDSPYIWLAAPLLLLALLVVGWVRSLIGV